MGAVESQAGRSRRAAAGIALLAVSGLCLLGAVRAEGALLGTNDLTTFAFTSQGCSVNPSCTFTQTKHPTAVVKAPFTGRITKWRLALRLVGTAQLAVMRRVPGGEFKTLRTSEAQTETIVGKYVYPTDLRIKRRQLIGITLSDGATVGKFDEVGAVRKGFVPALGPGETSAPDPSFSSPDETLQFNATLRR